MDETYEEWSQKQLEPFHRAIGRLCAEWADLEDWVGRLFIEVAQMPDREATYAMMRCLDLRDQLSAIKVGIVAGNHPEALQDSVISSANFIDNELRVRRNRLVHDRWEVLSEPTRIIRTQTNPKLLTKQSHQRPTVQQWTDTEETLEDVAAVIAECEREKITIAGLMVRIMHPGSEDQLAKLPPRQSLRPQSEKPRPAGKA